MADDKNERPLDPDQRLRLYLHIVDRVTSIFMLIVKAGMWVLIAFAGVSIVRATAGKETNMDLSVNANANIVLDLFSQFDSAKFAWLIAVLGIFYGFFEREMRRRKTEYLQGRITKLETTIDPKRESSGLSPRGETNQEDKL